MKTKKADEFLKRALTLPKLKFAVVGAGTTWTIYEGADLAKAVAQPGEQLIKANCVRKKENQLAIAVVGEPADGKVFKDKVFKKQVEKDPKSMTFKVVSAKEDSALDALANELDGTLVELVGNLPAEQRNALLPLLNEAKAFVADGDLAQAQAKVQEIRKRTSGSNGGGGTGSGGGGTPDEAAIRKKLLQRLRGPLVEQIAQLPRPRREVLTAPFNEAVKEATEGDLKVALLKTAQLEKAVAGGDSAAASTSAAKPGQQPAQGVAQPTGPGQTTGQTAAQTAPKAGAKPLPPTPQPKSLVDLQGEVVAAVDLPNDVSPLFFSKYGDELRKILQETRDMSSIADAKAARTKVLALRDRAAAIHKLADDVSAMNKSMIALALAFPHRQRTLAEKARAATVSDDPKLLADTLAELRQEHERLKTEGPPKAAKAQATIGKATDADLKKLSYARCNELMADMRQGDASTLDERKKSMAKLFKVLPLDAKFQAKDDVKRKAVLDALKDPGSGLAEAARNWNKMPNPKLGKDGQPDPGSMAKIQVLEKALEIQCRELGIKPVPKIKLFSDPAAKVDDHHKQTCAGYFNVGDGQIYLNDQSPTIQGDFDNALDTVIHENTHNYQRKLVTDLDAGRIKPGDDDYEQAVMFRLNSSKGGYIDSGDGYAEQPTELHAWMAGGEARKLFFADAVVEGRLLLEKMQKWVEANPGKTGSVPQWIGFVQTAVDSGKSNEVADKVRIYKPEFKRVVEEAAKGPVQGPREQAKALAGEMEEWVKQHPNDESRLRSMIEDLNAAPVAKARRLLDTYPRIFDGVKSQG